MSLHKIWLIARREFLYNVRRRSYLFTAFVIPILSVGLSIVSANVSTGSLDDVGNFQRVGIVDQASLLTGYQPPKPYELLSLEQAKADVASGKLEVYYVIPPDYLTKRQAESYSTISLPGGLDADFYNVIKKSFNAQINSPDLITRLQEPIKHTTIYQLGSPQKYESSVLFSAFFAPFIFGMLLFVSIMTTSQFLMSSVVEEKENRMMEVLTTSSRPSEMLWGKIFGLGALGLLQLLIWAAVGLTLVLLTQGPDNFGSTLASLQFTPSLVFLLLSYFLLGYLFNSAIMAAIGSTVNAEMESRQIISIFSLVAVVPFFFIITFLTEPDGTVATFLSLFPMTAPLSMIFRTTFTNVPFWQIGLSLLILGLSTVVTTWAAARVFRIGMLSYGKRMGIRDIIRAIRSPRQGVLQTAKGGVSQ